MSELGDSLERMSFMQLALLFGFVITYMAAVGGLFGTRVRLRIPLHNINAASLAPFT